MANRDRGSDAGNGPLWGVGTQENHSLVGLEAKVDERFGNKAHVVKILAVRPELSSLEEENERADGTFQVPLAWSTSARARMLSYLRMNIRSKARPRPSKPTGGTC